jgi:nicotinate-nucleotide pyrophosphorylase (carboxylating)
VDAARRRGRDVIMLDNMSPSRWRSACATSTAARSPRPSGGVRLDTVRAIAEAGVDWISVGALTHSARALDLALDFE